MYIENLILGSGISGLSSSYHLGHENCLILEKKKYPYGHVFSDNKNGIIWDEGPHVSFTKNEYVKNLFSRSVNGSFIEFNVKARNYFNGHFIDHPAQVNLYQVPEPLRTECLNGFIGRDSEKIKMLNDNTNYESWLLSAYGKKFSETFPFVYTKKYWTVSPDKLSTDWIGERMYIPKTSDVINGSKRTLGRSAYYIKNVRYPLKGGYKSFAEILFDNANITFESALEFVDLNNKEVKIKNGQLIKYNKLISTIPLPIFIEKCIQSNAPNSNIINISKDLSCSELLLINISVPHPTQLSGTWFYVYDKDKYSTRINCTEKLSPNNSPMGWSGIQVEVYFSKYKPREENIDYISNQVIDELIEIGCINCDLIKKKSDIQYFTKIIDWGNIIFDLNTKKNLELIWSFFEQFGLKRESDDTNPLTNWDEKYNIPIEFGNLIFSGRYSQWKYYWTDDCILRGNLISRHI